MTEPETLCFTYWTDPLCIWAYVAEKKLSDLLAHSKIPLRANHRVVPVFGDVSQRFATGVWRGEGREGRAAKTREVASKFAHPEVTGEVWVADPPATSWAPGAAIKAAFAAECAGDIDTDKAADYQWRLRQAFFADNQNTARRSVQLAVAEACGIPTGAIESRLADGSALAAMWQDYEDKQALCVRGSPTYVFDGAREMLYGNVPLALIRSTVAILAEDGAPGRSPC